MDIIERVSALLAKAEASPFPEEADAFSAKAQELISRHALDIAEVRRAGEDMLGFVGQEEIPMSGSYTYERAAIWSMASKANRCRILMNKAYGSRRVTRIHLIGREHDRRLVRVLAASLETQALSRLPSRAGDAYGEPTLTSVRRSFLIGYVHQLQRRLAETNQSAEADYAAATSQSLRLADDELDRYIDEHFNAGQDRSRARIDSASFEAGQLAAAGADVGNSRLPNGPPALRSTG